MQLHRLLDQQQSCFTPLPVDAALAEAITAMARHGKTAVVVVDGEQLKGILTRSDLICCMGSGLSRPIGEEAVSRVMTHDLVLVDPDSSLEHALDRMAQRNIEHLPVTLNGRLLTVLHEKQLLRCHISMLKSGMDRLQEYIDNLHDAAQD